LSNSKRPIAKTSNIDRVSDVCILLACIASAAYLAYVVGQIHNQTFNVRRGRLRYLGISVQTIGRLLKLIQQLDVLESQSISTSILLVYFAQISHVHPGHLVRRQ
jgi:hypothetical protein